MSIFDSGSESGMFDDDDEDGEDTSIGEAPPALPVQAAPRAKRKVSLVAQFDDNSRPLVARAHIVGGEPQLLEGWRKPSHKEVLALQRAGKLVRGGFIEETPDLPAQVGEASGVNVNWKKLGIILGGVAAVGTAGFVGYRYWRGRGEEEED